MFQVLQKKECIFLSTLFWYILKTSFIVYFIFFFSLTGISQTYEKLYKTQFDDISEDAIELPDKSIIISVTSGDFYQANYQAYLYKLSYAGLLIDSTEINIPEYYNLKGIDNIFKISDTSLLTLCICQNIFNDSLYVLITQFNFELKTLFSSLTNFSVPFNYSFTNHILNSENNLVSIGTEYSNYDHFIYEYDINGNLINHNLVIDPAIQTIASAIMDIENLGKYHLFLFFHPQDFLIINKETLEIDTILDYPSTFSPWDIHSSLNDSTYLTIGRNYIGNGIKVPAFLEMDNMGNVLNMHSYTANPDTNSGNIDKSLDIFNDKIFLVAAYNFLV
nr:hypothetical protein [Bacteroidota bacterium]